MSKRREDNEARDNVLRRMLKTPPAPKKPASKETADQALDDLERGLREQADKDSKGGIDR